MNFNYLCVWTVYIQFILGLEIITFSSKLGDWMLKWKYLYSFGNYVGKHTWLLLDAEL